MFFSVHNELCEGPKLPHLQGKGGPQCHQAVDGDRADPPLVPGHQHGINPRGFVTPWPIPVPLMTGTQGAELERFKQPWKVPW